jgi:hypothetical protein
MPIVQQIKPIPLAHLRILGATARIQIGINDGAELRSMPLSVLDKPNVRRLLSEALTANHQAIFAD